MIFNSRGSVWEVGRTDRQRVYEMVYIGCVSERDSVQAVENMCYRLIKRV